MCGKSFILISHNTMINTNFSNESGRSLAEVYMAMWQTVKNELDKSLAREAELRNELYKLENEVVE